MLDLFPDTARIEDGELTLGGVGAAALAERFGTPVVVYCEETIRARARAMVEAAPEATIAYGSKAFPNVAILRVLREEGVQADVASVGELAFARAAGHAGLGIVVHGNNKPDELLHEAGREGAIVVLDDAEEVARAAEARVRNVLVRITLGVEADTHESIKTGHHGSKFGVPPERALAMVREGLERGLDLLGVHLHVGSQVSGVESHCEAIELVGAWTAEARDTLGWVPRIVNLGGGFPVRHVPAEKAPPLGPIVRDLVNAVQWAFDEIGLQRPAVYFEPGRALVGQAGVTLYAVGSVKRLPGVTWVAVDGGMSDNPRPALYDARYTALSALRADDAHDVRVSLAGLHCESGDVLIDDVSLPDPHRGDLLAVPATGAYTLGMSSNYNATPRPAAVLVRGGESTLIRRRETIDDLLRLELSPSAGA
ncbi:MAG: diaminopimelate decarboxylase [Actinobacteria bacterium]|nr:diaminopimelate decarboxylase [Actinomycetota bacterium]